MDEMESIVELNFLLHEDRTFKSLTFPRSASVLDVKSMLCSDCFLNEGDCELLFCGHVMSEEEHLSDYNLGPQTTLHVVLRRDRQYNNLAQKMPENMSTITTSYLTGIWLHRQCLQFPYFGRFNIDQSGRSLLDSKQPQFYVYCKGSCAYVTPGKLRARCANCMEGCITLHRDPKEWMDVLRSSEILANCFSKQCEGAVRDTEFYFKCTSCGNQSGSVTPLPNVISNSRDVLCSTCMDVDNPIVSFPCTSDHSMCLACFEQYARNSLRERRMAFDASAGYCLPCPEGCRGSFLTDTHILHILGADEYATYQAFAAEECLLQKMRGMVCPNPSCGMGLYADLARDFQDRTEITCSECGFKFCSTCREASHGASPCNSQISATAGGSYLVRDYLASVKTIEEISKKCPKCKVPTERNGGCMHMTCSRCKFEWCWNCLIEWSRSCQSDHWFA